jgi:hypothetical protein
MRVTGNALYVAGFFSSASGTQTLSIASWDGAVWSPLGSGTTSSGRTGSGRALEVTGSELYFGGFFDHAGGKPANNIAMYHIPHSLSITRAQGNVVLSWPATGTNLLLEACADLGRTRWQCVPEPPVIVGNQCVVTNALSTTNQFFRLRRK